MIDSLFFFEADTKKILLAINCLVSDEKGAIYDDSIVEKFYSSLKKQADRKSVV